MAKKNAESLEKEQRDISNAFQQAFSTSGPIISEVSAWIMETYPGYVIACYGSKYYQIGYTELDGVYSFLPFSEWQEVEEQRAWIEKKAIRFDEIKRGARHSSADQSAIQSAHDALTNVGAMCTPVKALENDALVVFGSEIKATDLGDGNVKLAGYLVRFGDASTPDYVGDYFTKNTDFGAAEMSAGWFNHRMPVTYNKKRVTYTEQLPDVKLTKDNVGVFAEIVIGARNDYEKMIGQLGFAGKLGWSSGTAPHLVDRKTVGGAQEITRWHLGLDASLTPTPAEFRSTNTVLPIKSFIAPETDMADKGIVSEPKKENDMDKDELKAMLDADRAQTLKEFETVADKAATKAVEAWADKLPEIKTGSAVVTVVVDEADRPFLNVAEQVKAVRNFTVSRGGTKDPRLNRIEHAMKTMALKAPQGASEGVMSDGGILLDPTISQEIIKPIHEDGPFSNDAAKLPVGNNSNSGWINGVDETSRATGSRWGGIQGYRLAEAALKTASKPQFRRINWELKKYAVVIIATDELLNDATQFNAICQQGSREELGFMLNDDILNGPGLGGPLGILQSGAKVAVTRLDANKIQGTDISAMWQRMSPRSKAKAKWYVNSETAPQLDALFAVGSTQVLFPYAGYDQAQGVRTLYGKPIVETEFNAALGTEGDIMLADMTQYLLWQEVGGPKESVNMYLYWLTDETAVRFVMRVDGKPNIVAPLTPYKGTLTHSPFVTLLATS